MEFVEVTSRMKNNGGEEQKLLLNGDNRGEAEGGRSEDSWIYHQIDPSNESEISLHEKVIKMYELIEKRTVGNIEKKKDN